MTSNIKINDTVIPYTLFNAGEVNIKLLDDVIEPQTDIEAHLHSSDDIIALMMLVNAIRQVNPVVELFVRIPYMPYSRQDRVCNEGEALSIKVMCDIINSLNFKAVLITDPHSDVTPALLNNCFIKTQVDCLKRGTEASESLSKLLVGNPEETVLISPDAGASKKTLAVAKEFGIERVVYADKVRDTKTGEITKTTVDSRAFEEPKKIDNYLIVDDICDGGRTFIELSKVLQGEGLAKNQINLYLTHGIFSNGFEELEKHFNKIYCHNIFPDAEEDYAVSVELEELRDFMEVV